MQRMSQSQRVASQRRQRCDHQDAVQQELQAFENCQCLVVSHNSLQNTDSIPLHLHSARISPSVSLPRHSLPGRQDVARNIKFGKYNNISFAHLARDRIQKLKRAEVIVSGTCKLYLMLPVLPDLVRHSAAWR